MLELLIVIFLLELRGEHGLLTWVFELRDGRVLLAGILELIMIFLS